jgi:hypothetical protein
MLHTFIQSVLGPVSPGNLDKDILVNGYITESAAIVEGISARFNST